MSENVPIKSTTRVSAARIVDHFQFELQRCKVPNCISCDFQSMMNYLCICTLIYVWIATTQPEESLACGEVRFQKSEHKYLANHVMETTQVDSEKTCAFRCTANKSCSSINYKTSGSDKGRCELNNKTVDETDDVDEKIDRSGFNHLAVIERVSMQYNLLTFIQFIVRIAYADIDVGFRRMHVRDSLVKKIIDIIISTYAYTSMINLQKVHIACRRNILHLPVAGSSNSKDCYAY